jgi:hypothetical protein
VKAVNGNPTRRPFWIAILAVAVASALLTWDAISSLGVSDAQIAARAPEDTLGMGVYPVLLLFGGVGLAALVWSWRRAAVASQRAIAAVATLALVASATFAAVAYNVLRGRVLK